MIKTFKHKGLRTFFETGSTKGVVASHKMRLTLILTALDHVENIKDMDLAGLDLHRLSHDLDGQWSVRSTRTGVFTSDLKMDTPISSTTTITTK